MEQFTPPEPDEDEKSFDPSDMDKVARLINEGVFAREIDEATGFDPKLEA